MTWTRTYRCTADYHPYRQWIIEAESPCAARLALAKMLGIPYEQTEAQAN